MRVVHLPENLKNEQRVGDAPGSISLTTNWAGLIGRARTANLAVDSAIPPTAALPVHVLPNRTLPIFEI